MFGVTSSPIDPVAAGRTTDVSSVLVDHDDRHAVDLRLAHEVRLAAEPLDDARVPGVEVVVAEGVVEREQPLGVLDRSEKLGRRRADPLRRRVRSDELGELFLDVDELADELVVFGVRQLRVRRARGTGSCGTRSAREVPRLGRARRRTAASFFVRH